jgi:hypothetical protein
MERQLRTRMTKDASHIFFIYETAQVPDLVARIHSGESYTIVALDYEVELDLKKHGIPFRSISEVSRAPEGNRGAIEFTRHLAREWYRAPETAFFKHDNILLGEQHEGPVVYYLQTLLYYLIVLRDAIEHLKPTRISMPESHDQVPETADPTMAYKVRLPVDVARFLSDAQSIDLEVIPTPHRSSTSIIEHARVRVFQAFVSVLVFASNIYASMFQKQRPLRLLVTDTWSHVEPFISRMPEAEIVMTRREEMRAMWGKIRTHRTRFHHRHDFVGSTEHGVARDRTREFARAWESVAYSDLTKRFTYEGISFWPIAEPLFRVLVTVDAEDAIVTIENTKNLIERYGINGVILFASTKGYNSLIASVAETMHVPSIELQHALEQVEPTHPYARLGARYLAAYGALTRRHYERFGTAPDRIVECGSPRFDSYARSVASDRIEALKQRLSVDPGNLHTLVVIPTLYLSLEHLHFTSYAVQSFMEDLASLQERIPSLQFLLRPRPWRVRAHFFAREETLSLFAPGTVRAQFDDIRELLSLSHLVIASSSTVVLEALIMRRPVIMYVPRSEDHNFQSFEDAGAVLMARTKEELERHATFLLDENNRAALVARADEFLDREFCFDGASHTRLEALVRKVVSA